MLSYTRQKKGAGRKLTRPDCIMGRREGTLGNAGGGRLSEKGALPQRAIAKNPAPGRLVFSRNAVSSAARRTSSTPSPCLLALRENPAPHRRVLFGNCSPPTRKALAAFRQCGGIRGLALRENPAPHRRVLFGNCSPTRKALAAFRQCGGIRGLALRENPAPHRRVLFGNCSPTRKAHAAFRQCGEVRGLPCAKIPRRTGAFFSAIVRPHPESACCFHAIRRSTQLVLRENPAPHRRVLFGKCAAPPGKRMQHSCDAAQYAACSARKSSAAQARSFRRLLAPPPGKRLQRSSSPAQPVRLPNHAIST